MFSAHGRCSINMWWVHEEKYITSSNGTHLFFILSKQKTRKNQFLLGFYLALFPYVKGLILQWLKPLFLGKAAVFYFNPFLRPILPRKWHLKDVEDHSLRSLSVTTVKTPTQSRRSQLLNLCTQLKTIGMTSGMARSRGWNDVIRALPCSISSSAFLSDGSSQARSPLWWPHGHLQFISPKTYIPKAPKPGETKHFFLWSLQPKSQY